MNLYGAPAMTPKAFASYRQQTHRRHQPRRGAAARTVRFSEVDQPRYQSLVVQARSRLFAHHGQWVAGGDGRGVDLHRQHGLLRRTHADAGSDCRVAVPPHATSSSATCGWPATPTTSPVGGRRSAGSRTSTSSAIHGSARRFRRRSIATGNSDVREPRSLHDDRCGFYVDRLRLQLRVGALAGRRDTAPLSI